MQGNSKSWTHSCRQYLLHYLELWLMQGDSNSRTHSRRQYLLHYLELWLMQGNCNYITHSFQYLLRRFQSQFSEHDFDKSYYERPSQMNTEGLHNIDCNWNCHRTPSLHQLSTWSHTRPMQHRRDSVSILQLLCLFLSVCPVWFRRPNPL